MSYNIISYCYLIKLSLPLPISYTSSWVNIKHEFFNYKKIFFFKVWFSTKWWIQKAITICMHILWHILIKVQQLFILIKVLKLFMHTSLTFKDSTILSMRNKWDNFRKQMPVTKQYFYGSEYKQTNTDKIITHTAQWKVSNKGRYGPDNISTIFIINPLRVWEF